MEKIIEEKSPFETLESVKTKTGRFTIVQDQVRVNGHRQPYDYLEIREGVSILPIRDDKVLLQRQYRYPVRSWQWSFQEVLSIRERRRKKRRYASWEKRLDIQ